MSREEVTALLLNLQLSLSELQKSIDDSLRKLPDLHRNQLPSFLEQERRKFLQFQTEQLTEWDNFVKASRIEHNDTSPDTNINPLRSMESRIQKMGGVPALGGAIVLPQLISAQKTGLTTTASPAAVEMLRTQLNNKEGAPDPLKKVDVVSGGTVPKDSELGAVLEKKLRVKS